MSNTYPYTTNSGTGTSITTQSGNSYAIWNGSHTHTITTSDMFTEQYVNLGITHHIVRLLKKYKNNIRELLKKEVIESNTKDKMDIIFYLKVMNLVNKTDAQYFMMECPDSYIVLQEYHDLEFCKKFMTRYPYAHNIDCTNPEILEDINFRKHVNKLKLERKLLEDNVDKS